MIDVINALDAVHREVGKRPAPSGEQAHSIVLRREYDAAVEDVWDAVTNPERLKRWFTTVSGDFRIGGRYQVEGNAGGEILRCEPPHLLRISWVMGEEPAFSEVELRLTASKDGAATEFVLDHVAVIPADFWSQFGPGGAGVGWDLTLLGLGLHLDSGGGLADPDAWSVSPEGRQFAIDSSHRWGAALAAIGVPSEEVATMVSNTAKFYAPEAGAPS